MLGTRINKFAPVTTWKRSVLVGVAASFAVAILSLAVPNRYVSVAKVLPADQRTGGSLSQLSAAAAAVGVAIPGQDTADAAYLDILSSRWLGERLLSKTFTFKTRAWRFGPLKPRTQTLMEYFKTDNPDRGMEALKAHLSVNRDLKTKLLSIRCETTSPELSQAVVSHAVKLLEEFIMEKTQNRGGVKARYSDRRLKEARAEMKQAENELQDFVKVNRNHLASPDPAIRLRGNALEAELRLRQQVVMTLSMSREQALLEEKNDMPILNILDPGNLPFEKSGPSRSTWVLLTFVLSATYHWGAGHRSVLQDWFKPSSTHTAGT